MKLCNVVVGHSQSAIASAAARAKVVLTICSPQPEVVTPTEFFELLAHTPHPQTPAYNTILGETRLIYIFLNQSY